MNSDARYQAQPAAATPRTMAGPPASHPPSDAAAPSSPFPSRLTREQLDALPGADEDILGVGVLAGPANVIMQLAMPAVGYGVMEGRVESGNLFRHPLKRTRTTLSYLAVAALGSADDRKAYRQAVNKAHAQVRSGPGGPVAYNAFDPALQLWVAACLYKGTEDVHRIFGGRTSVTEAQYQRGAVMGAMLQMPLEAWPATRADFETYWQRTVEQLQIDPVVRAYLLRVARGEFLGPVVSRLVGWWLEILAIGFLPEAFRRKMDVRLAPWQQRLFDGHNALVRVLLKLAPRPVRAFPFNVALADVRRRIRRGKPLV